MENIGFTPLRNGELKVAKDRQKGRTTISREFQSVFTHNDSTEIYKMDGPTYPHINKLTITIRESKNY